MPVLREGSGIGSALGVCEVVDSVDVAQVLDRPEEVFEVLRWLHWQVQVR